MTIRIDQPLSRRAALVALVLCLLVIVVLVVGMRFVRPYLDGRTGEMLQRRQAEEAVAKKYVDGVKAECDQDPDCGKELTLEDLVDNRFQGQPVPAR